MWRGTKLKLGLLELNSNLQGENGQDILENLEMIDERVFPISINENKTKIDQSESNKNLITEINEDLIVDTQDNSKNQNRENTIQNNTINLLTTFE